jgi:hypothetical protein
LAADGLTALAVKNTGVEASADWVGSVRSNILAWWLPQLAIIAALFVEAPARTVIWVSALGWMGAACLLNARRCGRTHCRFTGPFYLAMILPVLFLATGFVSSGFYGWLALGAFIILGSKIIWYATERAWGKFS